MPQWLIVALRLTGLGWYVAFCIVLGVIGGVWLGKLTGQVALMVLIGTALGSAIAFYGVYRLVLPAIYGSKQGPRPAAKPDRKQSDHGGKR